MLKVLLHLYEKLNNGGKIHNNNSDIITEDDGYLHMYIIFIFSFPDEGIIKEGE